MRLGIAITALICAASACATPPQADSPTPPGSDSPFIVATFEAGRVHELTAASTDIWTANYEEGTIARIDPATNEVAETIVVRDIVGPVSRIVTEGDDVWLFAHDTQSIGHLDPRTHEVTFVAEVKPSGFIDAAVMSKDIWLAQYSGGRYIEPIPVRGVTLRSANATVPPPGEKYSIYSDIAAGSAGVWALDESQGTLAAIAPVDGDPGVIATGEPAFIGGYGDIAVGHGYPWVVTSGEGGGTKLARYDPASDEIETTTVPGNEGVLAMAPDAVWMLTHEDDEARLWRIDPNTLEYGEPFVLQGEFQVADVVYGFGSLWIPHSTNLMTRVDVDGGAHPSASPSVPERRGDAEVCEMSGPWVYCPEARWVRRVAIEAGLEELRDTGTAYEFEAGDHRIYIWNALVRPVAELAEEGYEPVPGTSAYTDGSRVVWEAQGLHIFISAADARSIGSLPDEILRRLIDASGTVPMEADYSGAKPQPTPTAEQRFENVGDRVRVWPVTEDVPNEGKYLFVAPHCGLGWMLDFDGSFWDAIEPADYGDGENYSFFYNSDEGVITFTGDDTAVYQASTGEKVRLERLDGPIVVDPCA